MLSPSTGPQDDRRSRHSGRTTAGRRVLTMRSRDYSESEIVEALAEGRPNRLERRAAKSMGLASLQD
jgi:hypothetical protein